MDWGAMFRSENRYSHFVTQVSDPVTSRILSFADLGHGWYYGTGKSSPDDIVIRALTMRAALAVYGAIKFEAFPIASGEILVSGYRGSDTVDIRVKANGNYALSHERTGEELSDEHDLTLRQVIGYLQSLSWREQNSLGSSTQNIIATNLGDSKASLLKNPTMAHLYSMLNARLILVDANVVTYENFILQGSPETPPYLFESRPQTYLLPAN